MSISTNQTVSQFNDSARRVNQAITQFIKAFIAGVITRPPYDLRPVPPFGIPAVISLACWGGAWAMVIWPWLKDVNRPTYWLRALVISAIFPSVVGLFIVLPLKGSPIAGGWDPKVVISALVLD